MIESIYFKSIFPSESVFNPYTEECIADPYPAYEHMHLIGGNFTTPFGMPVVYKFKDAVEIIRSGKTEKTPFRRFPDYGKTIKNSATVRLISNFLLMVDSDLHEIITDALRAVFKPSSLIQYEVQIQNKLDQFFYKAFTETKFDFVSSISKPLIEEFIGNLIGIPQSKRERISVLIERFLNTIDPGGSEAEGIECEAVSAELEAIFTEIIYSPKTNTKGLIALLRANSNLDSNQVISTCVFLLLASHTNVDMLGHIVKTALKQKKHFSEDKMDPLKRKNIFNECLRYDQPVQSTTWFATESLSISNTQLKPGQEFLILNGAANYDPNIYTRPSEFNPIRDNTKNLSFGYGLHFCLGFHLARIFCHALIQKIGQAHLQLDSMSYRSTYSIRGFNSLVLSTSQLK